MNGKGRLYGNMGMVTKKMGKGTFRQLIPVQT